MIKNCTLIGNFLTVATVSNCTKNSYGTHPKLEAFRQKLLEDGIDPAELLAAVGSSQPKAKSTRAPRPAKYKYTDENGNEQTCTGQGRTPKAIAAAIEAGETLEYFAI